MGIKTWGSETPSKTVKEETKKVKQEEEYSEIESDFPWKTLLTVFASLGLLLCLVFVAPAMIDMLEDLKFEDFAEWRDDTTIPDTAMFSVIVRNGPTEFDDIIIAFNETKGRLTSYNLVFTDNGKLCPVQRWEPWRHYLVDIKGYSIPDDSIYVSINALG